MRVALIASVAVAGLIGWAAPSQAAPTAPHGVGLVAVTSPEFQQVADGCGRGYHRNRWRDRYGYWRSRCVPNHY